MFTEKDFEGYSVPEHNHDGLLRWVNNGIMPGGFLSAVLHNNLKHACAQADHINQRALFDIVNWLWNKAPSTCWGSPERVEDWANMGGVSSYSKSAEGK